MTNAIFSVGTAAEWLSTGDESREHVANQLRRFRTKGYVQTQGKFGAGPTATHTFNVYDLATAKLCKGLMRFGIKKESIIRAVSDACYLPAKAADSGATPGVEAAFNDPDKSWRVVVFFHANADGTEHVTAEMRVNMDGLERIGGEMIVLTMHDWLPELAAMGA
ncbi:hypothetical protein [Sulfitobacter sp. MF3-043]|uniref:hypothetical protein n=1 Tax=Sulfitobacter sediminivivens TaxID=3252902 RepID=UPI0036DE078E